MSWSEALWKYCVHPNEFPEQVIKWNDSFTAIYDAFPKSNIHLLILPRTKIDGISTLAAEHIPVLRGMKSFAHQVIREMKLEEKVLKMGFHAIPSMKQLHMHIISLDFQGRGLKKKQHYNSFTTEFYLDVDDIITQLGTGKLNLDKEFYEDLLKSTLTCYKCNMQFKFLPKLKEHLNNCS